MRFSLSKGSLHARVVAAFVILGLLFAVEGALVVFFWLRIDNHSYQLELAQEARLLSQQTAMDLQRFLRGQKEILPTLTSTAGETGELFRLLKTGGSWKGKTIGAPDPIQALSLAKAENAWNDFFGSVTMLTTQEVWRDSTLAVNAEAVNDTTMFAAPEPEVIKMMNPKVAQARAFVDGQWLRFSTLIREFETDVRNGLDVQRNYLNMLILAVVLVDMIVLAFYYVAFKRYFLERLEKLNLAVRDRQRWNETGADEINRLGTDFNGLIDQVDHASDFVMLIGEGKVDAKLSASDENSKLAQALHGMQAKLKSINEEDQKRRWANEGLTQFVDILRSGNDNLHVLGDRVISTLVQYTKSNQGGLYLVEGEDDQKFLELISLFAFNTKKFEQQKVRPGEGLVGQCFLEKETIFLTEIPEDYIRITSGLGGSNPKSILIVPLKIDKEIYGIVELASFEVFEPHEISFVERLGETIASTLSSVKNNQKTRKLLEDFQMQAEQMKSQEEEMRQNMEELTATQEEMFRKEQDYILKINQLENQKPEVAKGDDWAIAADLEKTLRIQLEALDTAQRAISEKG